MVHVLNFAINMQKLTQPGILDFDWLGIEGVMVIASKDNVYSTGHLQTSSNATRCGLGSLSSNFSLSRFQCRPHPSIRLQAHFKALETQTISWYFLCIYMHDTNRQAILALFAPPPPFFVISFHTFFSSPFFFLFWCCFDTFFHGWLHRMGNEIAAAEVTHNVLWNIRNPNSSLSFIFPTQHECTSRPWLLLILLIKTC